MRFTKLGAGIATAIAGGAILAACGTSSGNGAAAAHPGSQPAAAASATITPDQEDACGNAFIAEYGAAAGGRKAGRIALKVPAACNGLSAAKIQELGNDAASAYAEGLQFGQALSNALGN